jgi:hypothetical protein
MAEQTQNDLISAALEIAAERDRMLGQIRKHLESGDNVQALSLMREYCGIGDEEKSSRIN